MSSVTTSSRSPLARRLRALACVLVGTLMLMSTLTNSVFILTVLACMATAHWLQGLLTPLMVAVFSLILIDSIARGVGRLLPRRGDYRWRDEGDTTPWYPTATLLRQTRDGDWGVALSALVEKLAALT